MSYRGVLFDLDGTLLDTLQDLADSVNRMLAARGLPIHPLDAYRYFVGDGARNLVTRALPADLRDAATVTQALADYQRDYGLHWADATRPYDGIPELLDELTARGMAIAVLSNKPHVFTEKCVAHFLGRWTFKAVLGQRDRVPHKPDPAGALEAAKIMNLAPSQVLYVGDTATDMQTARAAGMFPLGVTWGFRPESELRENGASAIAHHPSGVLDAIHK